MELEGLADMHPLREAGHVLQRLLQTRPCFGGILLDFLGSLACHLHVHDHQMKEPSAHVGLLSKWEVVPIQRHPLLTETSNEPVDSARWLRILWLGIQRLQSIAMTLLDWWSPKQNLGESRRSYLHVLGQLLDLRLLVRGKVLQLRQHLLAVGGCLARLHFALP